MLGKSPAARGVSAREGGGGARVCCQVFSCYFSAGKYQDLIAYWVVHILGETLGGSHQSIWMTRLRWGNEASNIMIQLTNSAWRGGQTACPEWDHPMLSTLESARSTEPITELHAM